MPTVPLTGSAGYFSRLGAIIGEYNRVSGPFYGSGTDLAFSNIWVQYASSDQAAVQNLPAAVAQFRTTATQYQNTLVQDGQQSILLQTADYLSVVPNTVQQAVTVLAAQMRDNGDAIAAPTLSASVVADGDNLGDATVCVGTSNPFGDPQVMMFAEAVTVTCTTAPTTGYAATLQAVGQAAVPASSYLWPAGSGATLSFAVTDPAASGGLVTDGGFANWSGTGANTPTNWTIIDGDAGVTVFQAASAGVRSGTSAAKLLSDGSQTTKLAQNVTVAINTVYAVGVQLQVSASDGSGTAVIQLTDGDGTVLQDDAGNDLQTTIPMTGGGAVTTSYQCFTALFSTPRQLPTTVQVRVGFGTAPASSKYLLVDLVGLVAAQPFYQGGGYIAAFAGASRTAVGDQYTATLGNTAGVRSFARGGDRLFNFRQLGVAWPSSNSPTVPDSIIPAY